MCVVWASGDSGCGGRLKLTSHVATKRGKVVAVTAAAGIAKKTKRTTVLRIVGSGRYSLTAHQTEVIKPRLNRTGERVLKARRRLPALLAARGPVGHLQEGRFVYKRSRRRER